MYNTVQCCSYTVIFIGSYKFLHENERILTHNNYYQVPFHAQLRCKHSGGGGTRGLEVFNGPLRSMAASNTDPVPRERSGHTAVVSEDTLFVWGGYVSVAGHEVFLPNNEIWLYDLDTGLWKMCYMGGEVPPSMSGTCGCNLNGNMYIFGGCSDDGQINEHYSVNLHDGKYAWKKLSHFSGLRPSPRDKLSCWVHQGRIIYFGGYGHKLLSEITNPDTFIVDEASWVEDIFWGWNSEVHVFDPGSKGWTEPQTFGHAPAPRAAHATATLGNKGYVCGGRIRETRKSDLHCLDLNTWTWSEIFPTSTLPLGRSWHTINAVSDTALFLFGGLSVDCRPMSDGWMFDLKTKEWREIGHSSMDKPRLWHTACLGRDSDVIVFGGSHDYILLVDSGHCNDALVIQTQPYSNTVMRGLHCKRCYVSVPAWKFTPKTKMPSSEKDNIFQVNKKVTNSH